MVEARSFSLRHYLASYEVNLSRLVWPGRSPTWTLRAEAAVWLRVRLAEIRSQRYSPPVD